jgi:hypothetical protein
MKYYRETLDAISNMGFECDGFPSSGSNLTTSVSFPIPNEVLDAFMKLPSLQREEIVKSWLQSAMPMLLQQIEQSICPPSPSQSSSTSSECSSTSTPDFSTLLAEVEQRLERLKVWEPKTSLGIEADAEFADRAREALIRARTLRAVA